MVAQRSEASTIDGQSRISIALLGGIFTVLVGATWGAASWATRVEGRLENIEKDISKSASDRWTSADMKLWVGDFRQSNPALVIPTPEEAR